MLKSHHLIGLFFFSFHLNLPSLYAKQDPSKLQML